ERPLGALGGGREIPERVLGVPEAPEGPALLAGLLPRPREREVFLEAPARLGEIAEGAVGDAEPAEGPRLRGRVAELPGELEGPSVGLLRLREIRAAESTVP